MNKSKECTKCRVWWPINTEFWHKKGNGLSSQCKKCKKVYDQQRKLTTPQIENKKKYNREYLAVNKDRLKRYYKEYHNLYYNNNREKLKNQHFKYKQMNLDKVKKYNREYKKRRRNTDPNYAL